MTILGQTLEDVQKAATNKDALETGKGSDSSSTAQEKKSKSSKKRKRTGELVKEASECGNSGLQDLVVSILKAVEFMVKSTKNIASTSEGGRRTAFSAEYMKTVIRSGAEESAKILGSWLAILKTPRILTGCGNQPWLSPFIEIWENHIQDDMALIQFSLHCTLPLLSLLQFVKKTASPENDLAAQLEQLIARNIIIPAKAAKAENPKSTLLKELTRISVLQNTDNAPILFEVAIRSIQPRGTKRRHANDESWLQTLFATLKEDMIPQKVKDNSKAICTMIQSAREHKVNLELSILREITSEFALPGYREDWELLAAVIKLDVNVFLIPNEDKDLLNEVLARITRASGDYKSWPKIANQVIYDVLVPLMNEFAKARDLSGFIHHWYGQLVIFEQLRKDQPGTDLESVSALCSAWEDDALQDELKKLLEASLTTQQIVQIIDWLSVKLTESPAAVSVILQAISGSVSREEVVDTVGLRCYHVMFDDEASEKLDDRYKWRSWSIVSHTLSWATVPIIEELSGLWGQLARPFDVLSSLAGVDMALGLSDNKRSRLDALEILRCASAALNAAKKGSHIEVLAKAVLLKLLPRVAWVIKCFPQHLTEGDAAFDFEVCGTRQNTPYRSKSWMTWAFSRCVFLEYPKVLE